MKDPTTSSETGSVSGSTSGLGAIEASFSTLAVSLGTQAVISLGLAANPMTGQTEKDRDVARFNIDLLRMLRDKTKGNLTQDEDKLLNDMIHDLQLKFVQSN